MIVWDLLVSLVEFVWRLVQVPLRELAQTTGWDESALLGAIALFVALVLYFTRR